MDKRAIETEATSSVKSLIRRNPFLSPYIDENDKTPGWDGYIYVYSTDNSYQNNKALMGKVPTQIKGHLTKVGFPEEIRYQVKKNDLRLYLADGGIIYIVVYINNDYVSKIYYEQLLPLDIERLMSEMEDKNSKLISFRMIPQGNLQLANLFLNFLENRKKQMGTVQKSKLHLTDWENNNEFGEYTFHFSSVNSNSSDLIRALSSSTVYLYGKPNQFNLEIPIERFDNSVISTTNIHDIGCCNHIYYPKKFTKTTWNNGNFSIQFGKAMKIELSFIDEIISIGSFHYNLEGSLNEMLIDSDFILEVLDQKVLTINNIAISINMNDGEDFLPTIDYCKKLKSVRKKLDELGIDDDFYIGNLKDDERWKINLLLQINENEEVKGIRRETHFTLFQIANIQLTLLTIMKDDKPYIRDLFTGADQIAFSFKTENDISHSTSIFLFAKFDALTSSNVFSENVYLDIIKYDTWDDYNSYVNGFLLECLKAYDSGKGNSVELLKLSTMISEWLLTKDRESEIYQINYLQTQARRRCFSQTEKDKIKILIKNSNESWQIRCCALILDANYTNAMQLLNDQTETQQQLFKSYPIYNLLCTSTNVE